MSHTKGFVDEARAYDLLAAAGLRVPRHGFLEAGHLPFTPGEPIVLKGLAEHLWHKSDRGAVHFGVFDRAALRAEARAMQLRMPEHRWIGALVCERVAFQRLPGLPTEALVSLKRDPEAGWLVVCGIGGLQADAWAALAPPMLWPIALTTPEQVLLDLRAHWLGRTWLGWQRGTEALTDEMKLLAYLRGLWRAVEALEREGVTLLELNPVVLDSDGVPTALDGVGTSAAVNAPVNPAPDPAWYRALLNPRSLVLAGVSSREGTVGRIILENLRRSNLPAGSLRLIKPGARGFLGLPCLASVAELAAAPTDQLILSLPAHQTLEAVEQLCHQGGGATVVYLVAGGLGDGADTEGLGQRLVACLHGHRRGGKWTPALVGPNGLGLFSPDQALNTLFIPDEKLPLRAKPGHVALVSQSGAFLITRLSRRPELGLRAAVAIGNQLDLRCSDFLRGFGNDPAVWVVGVYLEGFAPGDLQATAQAARALCASGRRVLLYKGGRSQAGMAAASSHTGALAGDHYLQAAVLRRAGVMLAERMEAFDAAPDLAGRLSPGTAALGGHPDQRRLRVRGGCGSAHRPLPRSEADGAGNNGPGGRHRGPWPSGPGQPAPAPGSHPHGRSGRLPRLGASAAGHRGRGGGGGPGAAHPAPRDLRFDNLCPFRHRPGRPRPHQRQVAGCGRRRWRPLRRLPPRAAGGGAPRVPDHGGSPGGPAPHRLRGFRLTLTGFPKKALVVEDTEFHGGHGRKCGPRRAGPPEAAFGLAGSDPGGAPAFFCGFLLASVSSATSAFYASQQLL